MRYIKNILNLAWILSVFLITRINAQSSQSIPHYYCAAVNQKYVSKLLTTIGSIHTNDFENLAEIAVFNLGMTPAQIVQLNRMHKVKVYDVEMKHPDILKSFRTSNNGRSVPGWFAWKPVVIKQALDMFPYIVYLDSGTTILKPMNDLFLHIKQNGYFLINCGHNIEERITKTVLDKVVSPLSKELQILIMDKNTMEIDAGFQGLSRAMYEKYALPVYEFAADLSLFADDGTPRLGFGAGRHDQILFSILAHTLNLTFQNLGWMSLAVDGKTIPFHFHWQEQEIKDYTSIYRACSAKNAAYYNKMIRYR